MVTLMMTVNLPCKRILMMVHREKNHHILYKIIPSKVNNIEFNVIISVFVRK